MACIQSANVLFSPVWGVLSLFMVYAHNYCWIFVSHTTWLDILCNFFTRRANHLCRINLAVTFISNVYVHVYFLINGDINTVC